MNAPQSPTRADVAAMVDHTLLKPEATGRDVEAVAAEADELGVATVCVSPNMVTFARGDVPVTAVVGFPSGKHHSLIKAGEARLAIEQGAREIDMVIDVGAALAGEFDAVFADILTVREAAARPIVLKVILESAALLAAPGGADTLARCCRAAQRAGADFVKTSTGFHQAGGASAEAVRIMAQAVGANLGVKASGGIRTADAALEMIAAGATRLGLSGTRAVLDGLPG